MIRAKGLMGASWSIVLVVAATGCASLKMPTAPVADVTPKRKERTREALETYERRRETAQFQAALDAWNQSDYDHCQELLTQLLQQNPAHREATLLLAELFQHIGRPADAVAVLKQSLNHHPHDAALLHAIGLSLDLDGDTDSALAYFKQAATIEPENEVFTASYNAALQPDEELSFPTELASAATTQNHAPPTPSGNAVNPVPPQISPLPKTEPAMPAPVVGAVAQGPAGPLLQQASKALSAGSLLEGEALLRQAASTASDNPQIPISAAVVALKHAQPQLAIELLQDALDAFPRCAGIHQSLALAFYRIGNYEASQVAARQALSLDNASPLTYFLLGSTAARMGSTDEAQCYLRQARSMDPRYRVSR